jgi:Fe2+ transport system protein B
LSVFALTKARECLCYFSLFDQQGYYKTTLNAKENSIQAWHIHSKEYQLVLKIVDSVTLYSNLGLPLLKLFECRARTAFVQSSIMSISILVK